MHCPQWRKMLKSLCGLDLGRTVANVELVRAIFLYYHVLKFQTEQLIIVLTHTHTHTHTHT